jgi:glyoxylate reductase
MILATHPVLAQALKERRIPQTRSLSQATALITLLSDRVDAKLLARAPKLKVIGNYAVGTDSIDLKACAARGIKVVNTPGVLTRATAELALTLLLAAARRVPEGEMLCRKNKFKGWAPDMLLGLELKGRTAVIVGQGRIGRETARLFRGIGLKTSFVTRKDSAATTARKLRRAQVLSLHIPGTRANHHWLSAARLKLLPHDAIVINTARGTVIDERALIAALRKRKIFAAGLDVYEREPKIPPALKKLPNVVLLPHLGSATRSTRANMAQLVISGVLKVLSGQRPPNLVKIPK